MRDRRPRIALRSIQATCLDRPVKPGDDSEGSPLAQRPRNDSNPQKNRAPLRGPGSEEIRSSDQFACALSAAMSASLRSVITPILLAR